MNPRFLIVALFAGSLASPALHAPTTCPAGHAIRVCGRCCIARMRWCASTHSAALPPILRSIRMNRSRLWRPGDRDGWQVVANRGDHDVWLKPQLAAHDTNLEIRTDKRSYSFDLVVLPLKAKFG